MEESSCDGERHTQLACENTAPGGSRSAHPHQGQDEKRCGDEVCDLDQQIAAENSAHAFFAPLGLNIFSMRSVMRNPPTMLLVAETIAIVPKTAASVFLCSPARMMAPTTAMVRDISGVCKSGVIRLITSNPMKAANMKTYKLVNRSIFISISPRLPRLAALVRQIPVHARSQSHHLVSTRSRDEFRLSRLFAACRLSRDSAKTRKDFSHTSGWRDREHWWRY